MKRPPLLLNSSLIILLIYSLFYSSYPVDSSPRAIIVPVDYPTIQEAVDHANSGDTIIVKDGVYPESVTVGKSLTIRSENGPKNCIVHDFFITGSDVTIQGFTINGNTTSGILIYPKNFVIKDNIISNHFYGIKLDTATNGIITDNIVSNNSYCGILIEETNNVTIVSNKVSKNYFGVYIYKSENIKMLNNVIFENDYNFNVQGSRFCHFLHKIDSSNKVDGKSIYYLVSEKNREIPSDAGYVGIVNSTNINVRDLILMKNRHGVLVAYSKNCRIENVNTTNNICGIYLLYSINCTLKENIMSMNYLNFQVYGNELSHFEHNIDMSNLVEGNPVYYLINKHSLYIPKDAGYIGIINSSDVIVKDLTIRRNGQGVLLAYSNNCRIENVYAPDNYHAVYLRNSRNNMIIGNTVVNSYYGVNLHSSSNNTIANNTLSTIVVGIRLNSSSNDNMIYFNNVSGNFVGIDLRSSDNNVIFLNNFIDNEESFNYDSSTTIWHSLVPMKYVFNGTLYRNYLGNYWSDYEGEDLDGDGIGNTPYSEYKDPIDYYPLMKMFEYYVSTMDFTPPKTTISPEGGVYSEPISVRLTAVDVGFGVNKTFYKIDGDEWMRFMEPFNLTAEGNYTISYYSVDNAGNNETVRSVTYTINLPPTPVSLYNPVNITHDSMKLIWTRNYDLDFAAYEIYQSISRGTLGTKICTITNSSVTSYEVTGLLPETTYYFTIRVVDKGGESADSNQVSGTTSPVQPVTPPASPWKWITIFSLILVATVALFLTLRRR
ncbi:hypothetical protein CW700_05065 [Candidatus Bathyarchaeota archaeon]|nr:MAG: hypothetical protein CW700_05065 [Candidatus Bathyarchaeota archaeon]